MSDIILECTDNLTQVILILAYAAISYKPEKHIYTSENMSWEITSKSPCIIFYKELGKAQDEIDNLIFVATKYFLLDDSNTRNNQLLKETIYKCKMTTTNTSGRDQNFTVLTQIPEGSIAISPPQSSKTHFLLVPNFATQTIEFSFYFQVSGTFIHIPGNVAVNGKIVAKCAQNAIKVLDAYDTTNLEKFKNLVMSGRKDLVLNFLRTENLKSSKKKFAINDLLWMLKNKDFWNEVISIFRSRTIYDEKIWSFAFIHNDKDAVTDILSYKEVIKKTVGNYFDLSLLKTSDDNFFHIEFEPLVNARAYKLGNQQKINNTRLREVYKEFLICLIEKDRLENLDLICLCQYLIYQERYNKVKDVYLRIETKHSEGVARKGHLQIQYDYLTCYLDLDRAQIIAPLYSNYPVPTWKKHFNQVEYLLQELREEEPNQILTQTNEPVLSFEIQDNSINLTYENVDFWTIRIYKIDLEVIFLKNPFLIQDIKSFGLSKLIL